MNDLGWQLDERATVYVPYTRLPEATQTFLASPQCTPCPVVMMGVSRDDWAYHEYMAATWAQRRDFINFEHDIVPWPGAIHELLDCPQPWCFYGYQDRVRNMARQAGAAEFGLVRFRTAIMEALPDVWKEPIDWQHLDIHFFQYATERGLWPHQHYPSVLNANPRILAPHLRDCLPQRQWTAVTSTGALPRE